MNDVTRAEQEYKHYLANREGRPSGARDDVKEVKGEVKEEVVEETKEAAADVDDEISAEEEALRTRSEEYALSKETLEEDLKEVQADAKELKADLAKHAELHSLSMPQIGKKKRMFAMRHGNDIRVYINPVVVSQRGLYLLEQKEECMPEQTYIIFRPSEVTVAYTTLKGEAKETDLMGLAAAEFVKQCERLDGILIWDFGKRCDKWSVMSEQRKQKVVNEYLEELRAALARTQEIVENNPELKEMTEKYEKIKEEMKEELKAEIKKHDAEMRAIAKKQKEKQRAKSLWN